MTQSATTGSRVAHALCVERAGETIRDAPDEYDPDDPAQWLLHNAQPHWRCVFCDRTLQEGPPA